jgi:uncharacterized RDD family membrane protein YckC
MGARLSLFGLMATMQWPGVWLLEATYWWSKRAPSIVSATVSLASRRRRLLAALIDALLLATVVIVGVVAAVAKNGSDAFVSTCALLVALTWLALQWLLLWRTGQSLGKRWTKIRIVCEDGSRARFARIIVVRSWIVPLVSFFGPPGSVILFLDPVAIWRRDRRCIHDIWAGTIVVDS